MPIIVHDMKKNYQVRMFHDDAHVDFHFRQLTYEEKSEIVKSTTSHSGGLVLQDINMSDYLSIKIALKKVVGLSKRVVKKEFEDVDELKDSDFETVDYELEFDPDGRVTNKCIDEIFNTPFEDKLTYTAKHLSEGIPDKIIHPFTKEEIEGVEVVYPKGGMPKKL